MKLIDLTCPHCSAHLQVNADNKQAVCAYCGTVILIDDEVQHVQYDNAEEAGYKFEKGRQRAQAEAQQQMYNYNQQQNNQPPKKKRTWLWVLGWICIFPLPLTILLLRKKNMKPALKYGLIAAAWILYLLIAIGSSSSNKNNEEGNKSSSTPSSTESTKDNKTKNNVTKIDFSGQDTITLKQGEESSGSVNVKLKSSLNFSQDDIVFVSENPNVATIAFEKASSGKTAIYYKLVAVNPGETIIYAQSSDGTVTSNKVSVVVLEPIAVESVSLSSDNMTLALGETAALTASITPTNADNQTITWSSSDTSIATVDKNGNIVAVSKGEATITAEASNGKSASLKLTVDGTKRMMYVRASHKRTDDINIGDEWTYLNEINGQLAGREYLITVGETLTLHAKYTESDANPDVGEVTKTYTVTENDIINGFTVTMELDVTENGGSNSGKSAHFIITFAFSPKQ